MLRDIKNNKFTAFPTQFSNIEQQYKTDNLGIQIKNTNLNHKQILSIILQQGLPEISSPYLKQNISKMFSHKKLRQLEPIMHELNSKERNKIQAEIVKNINQSIKMGSISYLKEKERKNKEIKIETKIFNSQHLIPSKIVKNYSLSRKNDEYLDIGLIDLKKSLELRQNEQKKRKQKSRKNHRVQTQQSQHTQQTSKVIFKKLKLLHQKESHLTCQPTNKESLFFKHSNKELKSPGFVMRQKLSKEMYGEQRQHLKLVNELMESQKGLNLSKGIKVKNYSKFLPKIMAIDD